MSTIITYIDDTRVAAVVVDEFALRIERDFTAQEPPQEEPRFHLVLFSNPGSPQPLASGMTSDEAQMLLRDIIEEVVAQTVQIEVPDLLDQVREDLKEMDAED